MQVREAMSKAVVEVGPDHTLRQAAQLMSTNRVGIITERDILNAIGSGLDPDEAKAGSHITWDVVYAGPNWTVEEAAAAMVRGGFRHLVVMGDEGSQGVVGVISVRDVIRVWVRRDARIPA
jgi:CBS domain-containing protein